MPRGHEHISFVFLYNILMRHIPIPEENKRILLPYKDVLLNLTARNVAFTVSENSRLIFENAAFC